MSAVFLRRPPARRRGPGGLAWAAAAALLLPSLAAAAGAEDAAGPTQAQAPAGSDDLYQTAKDLFDQYAPPEVKQQYEFPSRQEFDAFMQRLQKAFDGDSLEDLAQYEPQARAVLAVLRASPGYEGYADWLAARLDELDVARAVTEAKRSAPAPPRVRPPAPAGPALPYYDLWYRRLRRRPPPAAAAELMPRLRAAFASEGAPPDLAWLAEVESSLNPDASSPAGARGLFQLKADTARRLGLSTFLPDERTDPEKSARAAARLLRGLEERFGSWPLALAAYNAGEGRVSRALAARHATTFAEIDSALPAGTRMYVPEVCALVAVRTGDDLAR